MPSPLNRIAALVPSFQPFQTQRPTSTSPPVVTSSRRSRPDPDEKVPTQAGVGDIAGRVWFLPFGDSNSTQDTTEIRSAMRMMLRDPYVKAGWLTQVLTVLAQPFQVHPPKGDKSKASQEQADFVRHCLENADGEMVGIGQSILMNLGSDGMSLAEKVWQVESRGKYSGKQTLRSLKPKDPEDLRLIGDRFNNVTGVKVTRTSETYPITDFTYVRYLHTFDEPFGMAAFRAAYGAYWMRDTVRKLRVIHKEKMMDGLLVGEFSDPADKPALEAALARARTSTWLSVPEGVKITALAKSQASESDYKSFDESLREEILIAIAFAHLHILQGGVSDARGDTKIHKTVADLGPWLLTYLVQMVLNRQIIPDLLDYNYPIVTGYPRLTIGGVTNQEILETLQVVEGAQRAGFHPSRNYYATELTIQESDPNDPNDQLTPPAPAPVPGVPPAGGGITGGQSQSEPFSVSQFAELVKPPVVNITVPAPIIPAPVVNVPAPVVHVAAPSVSVTAPSLPPVATPVVHVTAPVTVHTPSPPVAPVKQTSPPVATVAHITARRLGLVTFAELPHAHDDLALAGKDGKRATELMSAARTSGRDVLARLTEQAVGRLLKEPNPLAASVLFDDSELKEIADSLSATNATADLLGRARVRRMAERANQSGGVRTFAEGNGSGPPGPPPRPGLTWKEETQRWVREDGSEYESTEEPLVSKGEGAGGKWGEIGKKSKYGTLLFSDKVPHDSIVEGWQSVVGDTIPIEAASALTGAGEDATVRLTTSKSGKSMYMIVDHPDFIAKRYISRNEDGDLFVHNVEFWMKESSQGKGLGADVFNNQVTAAKDLGLKYIECHAAKENPNDLSKPHNGYYTWPRFGYDQSLTDADGIHESDANVYEATRKRFPAAKSVLDVMSTPEGRDWWKANGTDMQNARFDLTPGSRSLTILEAYRAEKRAGGTKSNSPPSKTPPSTPHGNKSNNHSERVRADRFAERDADPFDIFEETPPALAPNRAADYFQRLVPSIGVDPQRFGPLFDRHAFTLAHTADQVILEKVKSIIQDQLSTGMRPESIADIQQALNEAGVTVKNPQYSDMVYRTNMNDSFMQGFSAEMADPVMRETFPAWQYVGIRDGRQGKDHEVKFDRYFPATASFAEVRGARVFNCRCSAVPVTKYELEDLQKRGVKVEEKW